MEQLPQPLPIITSFELILNTFSSFRGERAVKKNLTLMRLARFWTRIITALTISKSVFSNPSPSLSSDRTREPYNSVVGPPGVGKTSLGLQ